MQDLEKKVEALSNTGRASRSSGDDEVRNLTVKSRDGAKVSHNEEIFSLLALLPWPGHRRRALSPCGLQRGEDYHAMHGLL